MSFGIQIETVAEEEECLGRGQCEKSTKEEKRAQVKKSMKLPLSVKNKL